MPRTARQHSPTGFYHVLARGHDRKAIFRRPDDYFSYLSLFNRFKSNQPCRIFNFCLMPNHIHLLMAAEHPSVLASLMRRVQQSFQFYWRKHYHLVGNLWQGRFKSIPIENEAYLLECARYIELNPVRAKLCQNPEQYLWSSAQYYLHNKSEDWNYLDTNPVYLDMGTHRKTRQARYKQFLNQNRPYEHLVDAQMERLT